MSIKTNYGVPVRVTCKCGNVIPIPIQDWDQEDSSVDVKPDCAMGDSIEHTFEILDYQCSGCGHGVDGKFSVHEYPGGTYESENASDNVVVSDIRNAVSITL